MASTKRNLIQVKIQIMTTKTYTRYTKGYRFQIFENRIFENTPIRPAEKIETWFVIVHKSGTVEVKASYAWDGRSGLIRRDKTKGPSLFHDIIYKLIRMGLLPRSQKPIADAYYVDLLIRNKVFRWYAGFDGKMLGWFGDNAIEKPKKVYEANG